MNSQTLIAFLNNSAIQWTSPAGVERIVALHTRHATGDEPAPHEWAAAEAWGAVDWSVRLASLVARGAAINPEATLSTVTEIWEARSRKFLSEDQS